MSTVVIQSGFHDLGDSYYKSNHSFSQASNMKSPKNGYGGLPSTNGFISRTGGGLVDKKTVGAQWASSSNTTAVGTPANPLRRTFSSSGALNPSAANTGTNSLATSTNNLLTNNHNLTLQQTLAAAATISGLNNYNNKLTSQSLLHEAATLIGNQMNQQQMQQQQQHRKLDRSMSEPVVERGAGGLSTAALIQQQHQVNSGGGGGNSSRYKTELCRPYEENGSCKYGDKCQFAHGVHEIRNLTRHPKYKTELCRTFHSHGLCPYGPRCHFIHNAEEAMRATATCDGIAIASPTASSNNSSAGGAIDDGLGSAGNSPPNSPPDSGCFFEDNSFFQHHSASTPVTPTVNQANLFAFHGPNFNLLAKMQAASLTQQQDAYNRVMNRQFSLGAPTNVYVNAVAASLNNHFLQQLTIDSLDSVFREPPAALVTPTVAASVVAAPPADIAPEVMSLPLTPPVSPTSSVADHTMDSVRDSACTSPLDVSRNLRLPIFSQLSINDKKDRVEIEGGGGEI